MPIALLVATIAVLTHVASANDCSAITDETICIENSQGKCQFDGASENCMKSPCVDITDASSCRVTNDEHGPCRFLDGECARHPECSNLEDSSNCLDAQCWWASESWINDGNSGCFDLDSGGCSNFYDESSCSGQSARGCQYDGSMSSCEKSECLSYSQSDCGSKSDKSGQCAWNSGTSKCLRMKSCSDNSDQETCNADPTCIFDDYDSQQCFTFDKLCASKTDSGKSYCEAHDYTAMDFFSGACTWSEDEKCVPSLCANAATKEKCEETCDGGVKCGWYDNRNGYSSINCRRICEVPGGGSYESCSSLDHCKKSDDGEEFCVPNEGVESTCTVAPTSSEWRQEIDRCNVLKQPTCFDGGCKFNVTGCFPYDSPEEKQDAEDAAALAKALAEKEAACGKIETETGCFEAQCDYNGTSCSSYTCAQQGKLSATDNTTVMVQVTGPHWFGMSGLKCALETEPIGGTSTTLRVVLDASVVDKYLQPANTTGICMRSLGSARGCTADHSVSVNALFKRLEVIGVAHVATGARPKLSGNNAARSGFDVETDSGVAPADRKSLLLEGLELVDGKIVDPPSREAVYTWSLNEGSYSSFGSSSVYDLDVVYATKGIKQQNIAHAGGAAVRLVAANLTASNVFFSGNVAHLSKSKEKDRQHQRKIDDLRVAPSKEEEASNADSYFDMTEYHAGGGAIFASLYSFVDLKDSSFQLNEADRAGAVFVGCESNLVAKKVRFENNSALPAHSWAAGGAVVFSGGYAASSQYLIKPQNNLCSSVSSSVECSALNSDSNTGYGFSQRCGWDAGQSTCVPGKHSAENHFIAMADQHCAIGMHPALKDDALSTSIGSSSTFDRFLNAKRTDSNKGLGKFDECTFSGNKVVSKTSWTESDSDGDSLGERQLVKDGGGAIYSNIALTVTSSTFVENSAATETDKATSIAGGAVLARDLLDVRESTFLRNEAAEAGAIMVDSYFTAFSKREGTLHAIHTSSFVSNDQNGDQEVIGYRDSLCEQYDNDLCRFENGKGGLSFADSSVACSKQSFSVPSDPLATVCKIPQISFNDENVNPWCFATTFGTPCETSWYPKKLPGGSITDFKMDNMELAHLYNKFWDSQYCGCIPSAFNFSSTSSDFDPDNLKNNMNTWAATTTSSGHGDGICYPKTTDGVHLPTAKLNHTCTDDCSNLVKEANCYKCAKCMWTFEFDKHQCVNRITEAALKVAAAVDGYTPYDFKCSGSSGYYASEDSWTECFTQYDTELGFCRVALDDGGTSSSGNCQGLLSDFCAEDTLKEPFYRYRRQHTSQHRHPSADCANLTPSECAKRSSCEMRNQCGRDQVTSDTLLLQHCTFSPTDKPPKDDVYRTHLLNCADVGDTLCPQNSECVDRPESSNEGSFGPMCSCRAGTFGNLVDGCTACPVGQYRAAGDMNTDEPMGQRFSSALCKSCPEGWAAEEGSMFCSLCAAGKFADDTCKNCASGKYKDTDMAAPDACKLCPLGFAQTATKESCTECPTGRFSDNEEEIAPLGCSLCPAGRYQEGTGKGTCTPCEENTFSNRSGSDSKAYCKSCQANFKASVGDAACTPVERREFKIQSGTKGKAIEGTIYTIDLNYFTTEANEVVNISATTSDDQLCTLSVLSFAISGSQNKEKYSSFGIQTLDNNIDEMDRLCTINITAEITGVRKFSTEVVALTVADNDEAGILIQSAGGKRTVVQKEGALPFNYSIRLKSQPRDSAVTINPVWGDADDDYAQRRIHIHPQQLIFSGTNWNQPQHISLQSMDDNIKFDATLYTLQHRPVSTEFGYRTVGSFDQENIYCLIEDNDIPGIKYAGNNNALELGTKKEIAFKLQTMYRESSAQLVIGADIVHEEKELIAIQPEEIVITADNWMDTHKFLLTLNSRPTTGGGTITLVFRNQTNATEYNNLKSDPILLGMIGKSKSTTIHRFSKAPILTFVNNTQLNVSWERPKTAPNAEFQVIFEKTPNKPNCIQNLPLKTTHTSIIVNTCLPLINSNFVARIKLLGQTNQTSEPSKEEWKTIAVKTKIDNQLVTFGRHSFECPARKEFLNHMPNSSSAMDPIFLEKWQYQPCPLGESTCNETVAWQDLKPAMGWWCPSNDSMWKKRCLDFKLQSTSASDRCRFYQCPVPDSCLGNQWVNGTTLLQNDRMQPRCGNCKKGHHGILCSICEEGYTSDMSGACYPCSEPPANIFTGISMLAALVGVVFLFLLLGMAKATKTAIKEAKKEEKEKEKEKENREADAKATTHVTNAGKNLKNSSRSRFGRSLSSKSKILIGFVQVFTALNVTYDVPWPQGMADLMNAFSFVNFDVMGLLGSSLCGFSLPFLDGFVVQILLVPSLVVVAFTSSGISSVGCAGNGKYKHKTKSAIHSVAVLFLSTSTFCIYPGLSMKLFQVFRCDQVLEYSEVHYLRSDYAVKCWSEPHMPYVMLSVAGVFLFVIGIPLVTFIVLWKNRKELHDEHVQKRYGSLYLHCRLCCCFVYLIRFVRFNLTLFFFFFLPFLLL